MHELAITCNIVELVAEAAKGRKVARVTVEIGKLSGVMPDAIAFCFPEVAKGTEAEAAFLDICEIDAAARCDVCGTKFPTPTEPKRELAVDRRVRLSGCDAAARRHTSPHPKLPHEYPDLRTAGSGKK